MLCICHEIFHVFVHSLTVFLIDRKSRKTAQLQAIGMTSGLVLKETHHMMQALSQELLVRN